MSQHRTLHRTIIIIPTTPKNSFHHYLKKNRWKDYTVNKSLKTSISNIDQFIKAMRSECAVIISPNNSVVSKSAAISIIEKSNEKSFVYNELEKKGFYILFS